MNIKAGPMIGYSCRLPYDNDTYYDKFTTSTDTLKYLLDENKIYNTDSCLSDFGPISSYQGYGTSTNVGNVIAPSQKLVDLESILSNRNVKASKSRSGKVNDININKIIKHNAPLCKKALYPKYTRLDYPSINFRGQPINRFYNLNVDPQRPIFYNFAVNTTLEAKDNYLMERPEFIDGKLP